MCAPLVFELMVHGDYTIHQTTVRFVGWPVAVFIKVARITALSSVEGRTHLSRTMVRLSVNPSEFMRQGGPRL
jgi:hypothetical protein